MWVFPENPHGWRNRRNDENINGQSVNQLLLLAKDDRNNLGIAQENQDTDKKIIGKYKPIKRRNIMRTITFKQFSTTGNYVDNATAFKCDYETPQQKTDTEKFIQYLFVTLCGLDTSVNPVCVEISWIDAAGNHSEGRKVSICFADEHLIHFE